MARDISNLGSDLRKLIQGAGAAIDDRTAAAIGFTIRHRMLSLISRGISPILGFGRFPEYKAASKLNSSRRAQRVLRTLKNTGNSAQVRRKKQQLTRSISSAKKGYPFSVQKQFPNKRQRPVNLFLSGDFLSNLTYAIGRAEIEVGYFDELSAKKESGHREGVNGQPKRPTIPTGSQRFAVIIVQDAAKIARDAISNYFRKAK